MLNKMEKEYWIGFTKEVTGTAIIKAKNLKEAKKKFLSGDIDDEFDHNSNYTYDENNKGEPLLEEQ